MKQATKITKPTMVKGIGKEEVDVRIRCSSYYAFYYTVTQLPYDKTYPSGHVA